MRTRKRAILPWVFSCVGFALLVACTITALAFAARQGWLTDEWRDQIQRLLEQTRSYLPGEEWLRYLAWLAGIAVSAIGAAVTLLASWHFAEINLPRRLKELKDSHTREHLAEQPGLLTLARGGLGPVVADIETSRITLLRKWLSGWSSKEAARVLAASANRLREESSALAAAVEASQHRQITAHLIRGYQHASQDDDDKAFDEFEAATQVTTDDIISRDIAAGWARKLNKPTRELQLLRELQDAAANKGAEIDVARALRREAELLDKRKTEASWIEARNRLAEAARILEPFVGQDEGRRELGRALTLFCEVQCSRTVVGALGGKLTRLRACMTGVAMHTRPEEPGGESYGEKRANAVMRQVAELRGDVVAAVESGDQQ
jgi:hypothetical protein